MKLELSATMKKLNPSLAQASMATITLKAGTLRLKLPGLPPSKKNSKMIVVNRKTHRPMILSAQAYRDWEEQAVASFKEQAAGYAFTGQVAICMTFVCSDNKRFDLSNKLEGPMDALVKAGIIKDDSRKYVPSISACAMRGNAYELNITITELA